VDLQKMREENQILRDEINHLKGEQGKPDVKANKEKSVETTDHSSESERKQPRKRHGRAKETISR
jgi:regulator of replication initiation timing